MTLRNIAAVVAVLVAYTAEADDLVNRADANGDGFVSLYELRAAYYADIEFNRRIEQSFAAYDTNGDGLISEAERRAAQAVAESAPAPEAMPAERAPGEPTVAAAAGATAATGPNPEPLPPTRASGEAAFAAATAATAAADAAAGTTAATNADGASRRPPATNAQPVPRTLPATVAEVASRPPAATATTPTAAEPNTNRVAATTGGSTPDIAPATPATESPPGTTRRLTRSELWIEQIDADNSGGASFKELLASNDGEQFFPSDAFSSADKNDDAELDPEELEALIQSIERRQRYQQRGRQ